MKKKPRKPPVFKPMEARFNILKVTRASGAVSTHEVSFKSILSPLSIEGNAARLSGLVLDDTGMILGTATIGGFPTDRIARKKPAGRKENQDNAVTVYLDWVLHVLRGASRGDADEAVAVAHRYGEARYVKAIRAKVCEGFSLPSDHLNLLMVETGGVSPPVEWACLINYRSHAQADGFLNIRMQGWRWNGSRLKKGGMTLTFSTGEDASALLSKLVDGQYVTFACPSESGGV